MTSPAAIVAFVDLSMLPPRLAEAALEQLRATDQLGGVVRRAVVVMPSGCDGSCAGLWLVLGAHALPDACGWSFDAADEERAALLIVSGGARPRAEAVEALAEALDQDPLFGVALPRLVNPETQRLALIRPGGPSDDTAPLRLLSTLPTYRVMTEHLGPCLLVRRELVGSLSFVQGPGSWWAGVMEYCVRARRCGFRTVLCNQVVVDVPAAGLGAWGCSASELAPIQRAYPETLRMSNVTTDERARNGERLVAALFDEPDSLLLEARNLSPIWNGTSQAILKISDAIYRAAPGRAVAIWAGREPAEHYRLATRYPGWQICTTVPGQRFAAGLRLSQPWYHAELDDLGQVAAVNAFLMLDTIAWDALYPALPGLDRIWTRMARETDGIVFISNFARRRFEARFAVAPGVHLSACPLSLAPADYVSPATGAISGDRYWLIVGNRYDHKHVGPTVDLLTRAFPNKGLVVFGDREQPRTPLVKRFESGLVSDEDIQRCYAGADVLVFPSFTEGFGFPIVQGLAYGRTVLARDSALVRELAALYQGPGRLLTFDSDRTLVEQLGRLERGEPVTTLRLGEGATGSRTWDTVASSLLDTIGELVAMAPSPRMLARTSLDRGLGVGSRAEAARE